MHLLPVCSFTLQYLYQSVYLLYVVCQIIVVLLPALYPACLYVLPVLDFDLCLLTCFEPLLDFWFLHFWNGLYYVLPAYSSKVTVFACLLLPLLCDSHLFPVCQCSFPKPSGALLFSLLPETLILVVVWFVLLHHRTLHTHTHTLADVTDYACHC